MLEVKSISKSYKVGKENYPVLKNLSFSVQSGEFVGVMGPSGSGKTTMLNCISCFQHCDSGEIILNGKNITKSTERELAETCSKELGFVFQDFMLLDGLTVFDNICIPNIITKTPIKEMEEKAQNMLKFLGIEEICQKYPAEISGGQKQRVAVARALMNNPSIVLADEPTGNLDSKSSLTVIQSFLRAKDKLGTTIFMVTHDIFSASYCDRVIILKDGEIVDQLVNNGNREVFFDMLSETLKM